MEMMQNSAGKTVWVGVSCDDPFSPDMFHDVDMSWSKSDDEQVALHANIGSLTVLYRMTGFGWRDTETGYRDPLGNFWLASGNYDVRYSGAKTIGEAICWVKQRANNCNGDYT